MSFQNWKTGRGAQPLAVVPGGYLGAPSFPTNSAPHVEIVPAGAGPICSPFAWGGQGFPRAAFTSHPPMSGPRLNRLNAVWIGDIQHGIWPY